MSDEGAGPNMRRFVLITYPFKDDTVDKKLIEVRKNGSRHD